MIIEMTDPEIFSERKYSAFYLFLILFFPYSTRSFPHLCVFLPFFSWWKQIHKVIYYKNDKVLISYALHKCIVSKKKCSY